MREAAFHQAIADATHEAPHPRFGVYRNNVESALINALRVCYPVVDKLLGPREFAAFAQEFVAGNRPRSPVLIDYGHEYPDFIAARDVPPYLADVARLESLWWRAYHAADAEIIAAEHFARLTSENFEAARFGFHPSAAILVSPWAVGAIWEAARRNAGLNAIAIAQPQSVLVWRPHADVRVHVIDGATAAFLAALMEGKALIDAIGAGPCFDLQAQFRMLVASELVTAIATGVLQ